MLFTALQWCLGSLLKTTKHVTDLLNPTVLLIDVSIS